MTHIIEDPRCKCSNINTDRSISAVVSVSMSVARKKLLIDTDAGVDDAQAILMALQAPDVDVIGITCVMGNADSGQVGLNVLRILQVVDRLDVSFAFKALKFAYSKRDILSPFNTKKPSSILGLCSLLSRVASRPTCTLKVF